MLGIDKLRIGLQCEGNRVIFRRYGFLRFWLSFRLFFGKLVVNFGHLTIPFGRRLHCIFAGVDSLFPRFRPSISFIILVLVALNNGVQVGLKLRMSHPEQMHQSVKLL